MNTVTQQILSDLEQLPDNMQAETLDFVQFLKTKLAREQSVQPKKDEPNGKAVAAILKRMAQRGALSTIKDPSAWQREIREDRPLPGRES